MDIRAYRSGDALPMFVLDRMCFEQRFRFSLHAMRDFAEAENAVSVVAEAGGELVGFSIVEVTGDVAYLVTLDVHPDWRRRGLARRMMDWLEHRARTMGARRVELHVFVGNEGAIRFYEGDGFERLGRVVGFYGPGVDALFYSRQISQPS